MKGNSEEDFQTSRFIKAAGSGVRRIEALTDIVKALNELFWSSRRLLFAILTLLVAVRAIHELL
jgi:hypothetical protein